jgi:hypothetical protein
MSPLAAHQIGLVCENTSNRRVGCSSVRRFVAAYVAISAAHRDVAPAEFEAYWARATSFSGSKMTREGPNRSTVHRVHAGQQDNWDSFKKRFDVAPPKHGANLQFSFMAE